MFGSEIILTIKDGYDQSSCGSLSNPLTGAATVNLVLNKKKKRTQGLAISLQSPIEIIAEKQLKVSNKYERAVLMVQD